jgi:hypothetical protein
MSRGGAGREGGKHHEARTARNARNTAYMNLAKQLATVFGAGVYTKEELHGVVCTYVNDMKKAGENEEAIVKAAENLVAEVGARFPASGRTQVILADMVSLCLAEYYRESA